MDGFMESLHVIQHIAESGFRGSLEDFLQAGTAEIGVHEKNAPAIDSGLESLREAWKIFYDCSGGLFEDKNLQVAVA